MLRTIFAASWFVASWTSLSLVMVAPAAGQLCAMAEPETSRDVVVTPNSLADECDHLPPTQNPIDFFDAYSWRLFTALNWPAAPGQRGVPDTTKTIVDQSAPRVWETWKSTEETFFQGGAEPPPWNEPETHKLCKNTAELPPTPTKLLADLNQGDTNGGALGPLIAQNRSYVRYEIRLNKLEFDEIVNKKLYIRANLPGEDAAGPELPILPNGTIDIKAAWRELRPGESADRYYRTDALAVDPVTGGCDKRSFVLIGFHIAQKTPRRPQWIWSTFEHVDNITVGPDAPPGTQPSLNNPNEEQRLGAVPDIVDRTHPPQPDPRPVQVVFERPANEISPQTKITNTKWQGSPELRNSVWRFYQLIKTQWPVNPSANEIGNPFPASRVANMAMETYIQRSTCITCHAGTSNRTDFAWFISLRAHPPKLNLISNAKTSHDNATNP
jgi:hypothetical protein